MPYLCDVKNKLNSITMKYKSRSIAKVIVPVFLVVSLFAFTTHTTEQPEGTPLFITGITPYKSGMIVSQKGVQKVSIYSSDYKERLQEWELDEVPTGVATDGEQIYATVAGTERSGCALLFVNTTQSPIAVNEMNGRFRSIWNQACISSLRSASGLFRYARRTADRTLLEKANLTKELALSFPMKDGFFYGLIGTDM